MKKKTKQGFIIGLIAASVIVITGCADLFSGTNVTTTDTNGYVYNTTTGAAMDAASVTLTSLGGSTTYTTTSNSSGYYYFGGVSYGKYELTATKDGYTFIKQIVEIASDASLPNTGGFTSAADGVISIVTFWDREFGDVDAHLTFPTADVGNSSFSSADFYTPTNTGSISAGFLPSTTTSPANRTEVNYGNTIYNSNGANITMNSDSNLGVKPETITINFTPDLKLFDNANPTPVTITNTYTTVANDPFGFTSGLNITCVGVMEFYLDSPTTGKYLSTNSNTNNANPQVFVFSGNEQIAHYTLPDYTTIKRASIFRINVFRTQDDTDYLQIVPDTRVLSINSIMRGINTSTPIVIKGRTR